MCASCAATWSRKEKRLTNPAQHSPLVAQLFDARVVAAELRDDGDAGLLYPAEAAFCTGFAPKRIAEFAAGRLCARRVLADLGVTDFPIAVNPDRSPRWPVGIVGSISHTSGYCCAVAGREGTFGGIGVDVEIVGRVTPDLDRLVFTERESSFLSSLTADDRTRAATVIFSAKEAFYKCQYPVTRKWLDFADATLELTTSDMLRGEFVVETAYAELEFASDVALPLRGRFYIENDVVVTGMSLCHSKLD